MQENWVKIDWYSANYFLFIPSDLFIYFFSISESNYNSFIKFIENLTEFKGWYFGKHFMCSRTKLLNSIWVDISQIEKLSQYADVLKSIQVRLKDNLNQSIPLNTIFIIIFSDKLAYQILLYYKIRFNQTLNKRLNNSNK